MHALIASFFEFLATTMNSSSLDRPFTIQSDRVQYSDDAIVADYV